MKRKDAVEQLVSCARDLGWSGITLQKPRGASWQMRDTESGIEMNPDLRRVSHMDMASVQDEVNGCLRATSATGASTPRCGAESGAPTEAVHRREGMAK